jgi:hypothetical protein
MAEDVSWDFKKEFLILVPVLGSALAILYDVGYFTAIGLNWFSVFSITEHITFALQILPFALTFAAGGIFGMLLGLQQGSKYPGTNNLEKITRLLQMQITTVLLFVVMAGLSWFYKMASFATMAGGFLVALLLIWFLRRDDRRYQLMFGFGLLFLCAFAFALGYDVARGYQNQIEYPYTVATAGGDQNAKVVRSGDRGLLFYESGTAQLVLLPWSEVKKVKYKR